MTWRCPNDANRLLLGFAMTEATLFELPAPDVMANSPHSANGPLIADCARLGYLPEPVLDVTYGRGLFWSDYKPEQFTAHDLYHLDGVDFRHLPEADRSMATVVFDPPYKLNGTPSLGDLDARYGVEIGGRDWKTRMQMMMDGFVECARVTNDYLLMKCQDQVVSGAVRWQTDEFSELAKKLGLVKKDSLNLTSYRPQPPRFQQVHARRNFSTLLVFRKPR
jgi:hypothetical protein